MKPSLDYQVRNALKLFKSKKSKALNFQNVKASVDAFKVKGSVGQTPTQVFISSSVSPLNRVPVKIFNFFLKMQEFNIQTVRIQLDHAEIKANQGRVVINDKFHGFILCEAFHVSIVLIYENEKYSFDLE